MNKHHSGLLVPRAVCLNVEERYRKRCPHLPQEVWELISGHFTLKEWVRLSMTCRTLYKVKPRRVQIAAGGTCGLGALRWMRDHWSNASDLALQINVSTPDLEKFIQEAGSMAPTSGLKTLHVASALTMKDDTPSLQAWLKRVILAQVDSLKILSLHMRTVPDLPALQKLQSLVLCTRHSISQGEVHCISQLPCLTSLWLGCEYGGKEANIYEVDLALCAQLQRVCFSTTLPKVIRLPPACRLGIKSTARQALADPDMWRERCSLLDLHLNHHVEWVKWQHEFCTFLGMVGLPPFLLLTSLTLRAETLGHRTNHLVICSSHLPALTELRIRCLAMYLTLGSSNMLKTISLSVEFGMRIDVVDLPALCSHLESIRCYSTVEHCQGAIQSIGRSLEHSGRFPIEARWTFQRIGVLNNCGKPKTMGLFAFPREAIHDGDASQCKCQACTACLLGV